MVSTDGVIGKSANAVMRALVTKLVDKWGSPYPRVCNFINTRIAVAIARATNRCIRGSHISPTVMSDTTPQWEDGAGLGLFRAN